MLGAPWTRTPAHWALNGRALRVQVPSTIDLARAITRTDSEGAGLWCTTVCTHPADQPALFEQIIARHTPVTLADLDKAADTLVQRVTGWKRWEAAHVWSYTLGGWPTIDGDLMGRGVDLTTLPAGRATNTAYAWWQQRLGNDEQAWKKFVRDMERTPTRIIEAEAAKPLDPALYGLVNARPSRSQPDPSASTIPKPDQIP